MCVFPDACRLEVACIHLLAHTDQQLLSTMPTTSVTWVAFRNGYCVQWGNVKLFVTADHLGGDRLAARRVATRAQRHINSRGDGIDIMEIYNFTRECVAAETKAAALISSVARSRLPKTRTRIRTKQPACAVYSKHPAATRAVLKKPEYAKTRSTDV